MDVNGQRSLSESPHAWQQMEDAYRTIQRRDGSAEARAWHWERVALGLLGLLVATLGVIGWQLLTARQVQAVVQVVQVDAAGQVLQMGLPQALLAYTPDDGIWMDMLASWVRWVRWRGTDLVLAKREWASAYRHTCSTARRFLQALEEKEQPFRPSKRLTAVELKSITKTPSPQSYQVLWAESSTDGVLPSVTTTLWTGTFTVGRIQLKTLADALDNRLGLCVSAYDLSPQP